MILGEQYWIMQYCVYKTAPARFISTQTCLPQQQEMLRDASGDMQSDIMYTVL
jgi:hypothetical protein